MKNAIDVSLWLMQAISQTRQLDEICAAALDALGDGLGIARSAILLFDEDGVMRFKAWRGLSDAYRNAMEGHTPWAPDAPDPQLIVVPDVEREPSLAGWLPTIRREHISAMVFIPLVSGGRLIGKFMLYDPPGGTLSPESIKLAGIIASEVAFAVERMRAQDAAERSEARLRFAVDAAAIGTWEWNVITGAVRGSEGLERLHGCEPGRFASTFAEYLRLVHPEDRSRLLDWAHTLMGANGPSELEFRIITPAGVSRWIESKAHVEYRRDGTPARVAGITMDVTARKQAELARLESAEESSRLKDEFLAMLSHELRTPLNAIVGWLQVIRAGHLSPERLAEAMGVIERNASRQTQLIDQILDVSRIITGKLRIDRRPLRIGDLVASAIGAIKPVALSRHLEVTADVARNLPAYSGDAERLQQALANLLSNALKFTPDGGHIALRCVREANEIVIEVRDSGCGIAPEFLPYVFDRFRQADATTTRTHGGLGLGLAIARHMVELHGGAMQVQSDGAGAGAAFRVRLPVADLPIETAPPPAVTIQPRSRRARQPSAEVVLHGLRVLVVDDEADARDLVATVFAEQGSIVEQSASAEEALDRLEREAFHIMIADLAMPLVDGCELVRRVKRRELDLRTIAITAHARPEDRIRALEAGFDAFHVKPFDTSALLRTARELCHDPDGPRLTT
jgi:PAS domain S-box-containing protein